MSNTHMTLGGSLDMSVSLVDELDTGSLIDRNTYSDIDMKL